MVKSSTKKIINLIYDLISHRILKEFFNFNIILIIIN